MERLDDCSANTNGHRCLHEAIKLSSQSKTYNGKAQAYSGKVTKTGSTGKVTYSYYSDAKCTKEVKAANVKAAKTYYVKATVVANANYNAATSVAVKFTVNKAANQIAVKSASKTIKHTNVKKKAQTIAPITVSKAQGTKTFALSKSTTKTKKYFSVNKSTGKVTAKKGTPKGTYKFQVKVTAKGNTNYKAESKAVTVTVIVK